DPSKLELLGFTNVGAGYTAWLASGFFADPDNINQGPPGPGSVPFNDGNAKWTGLAGVGNPAMVPPPPGIVLTTIRFRALAPTSGTIVQYIPQLGTFGFTEVYAGMPANFNCTGDVSGTSTVRIINCDGATPPAIDEPPENQSA